MPSLKLIIKSLNKRKLSTLLLAIQVVASLLFFISIAIAIQNIFYLDFIVPKNLKPSTNQTLHIRTNREASTPEKYFAFRNNFLKQPNIKFIGSFDSSETIIIDALIDNSSLQKMRTEQKNDDYFIPGQLSGTRIEKGIQNLKPLKIIKGRNLYDKDFDPDLSTVPVLVGYKLVKYGVTDIGSEYYDSSNKKTYKVVGILDEGSTWFTYSPSDGIYENLDDKLIIPTNDKDYYPFIPGTMENDYYCVIENSNDIPGIITAMIAYSKTIDFPMEIHTIKSELDTNRDKVIKTNVKWLIFSLFFIIMTSFGLASIILSSMVSRMREIGIRIAVGYSMKDIQKLLVGEILTIVLISVSIAISFALYTNKFSSSWYNGTTDGYYISPSILVLSIVISLIMSIPAAIMVAYKVAKIQPQELVGGKE